MSEKTGLTQQFSFRMTSKESDTLMKLAAHDGRSMGNFVRLLIRQAGSHHADNQYRELLEGERDGQ